MRIVVFREGSQSEEVLVGQKPVVTDGGVVRSEDLLTWKAASEIQSSNLRPIARAVFMNTMQKKQHSQPPERLKNTGSRQGSILPGALEPN